MYNKTAVGFCPQTDQKIRKDHKNEGFSNQLRELIIKVSMEDSYISRPALIR